MTGLSRLAALFVEPAPRAVQERRVVAAPTPAAVGVLATERHALAVGSAVALALADAARASHALVCCWPPAAWSRPATGPLAFPAARRLAGRLDGRGIAAVAAGRLALVALPADEAQAVIAADRAIGAASGPAVVVIAGPRPEELDELLLAQDAIVVAAAPDGDERVVDLAVASFADRHPSVSSCRLALGPLARALATGGLAAPLGARGPLAPVLEVAR